MKVELPETFALPTAGSRPGDRLTAVDLGFTGHVILPDAWTGRDFEDLHLASVEEDDEQTVWERQWQWANDRIVEWAIDDVPTNPNEIAKGQHLTWALESFLANATIHAMNDYGQENLDDTKASIDFPTPANLMPHEFLGWHKAQNSVNGSEPRSALRQSWEAGHILVRGWPDDAETKDYYKADLRLIVAIDQLMTETILPAIHLGNWSARPGGA